MRIIIVLILTFSIGLLGFMAYLDLNEDKITHESPLTAFPSNPLFLLEINEVTSSWNHFTETNMIWSEFVSNKDNLNQYGEVAKISQFLNNELVEPLINDGKVYVGGYHFNGELELLLIQNIYAHIKEDKLFTITDSTLKSALPSTNWVAKYSTPFIVLSSSKELLNKSIENISNKQPLNKETKHEKTKKLISQSSSFSCFVDVNQFKGLLSDFDSKAITYLEQEKGINNWFQFDFNYTPNAINIIGVSDCRNKNLQTTPQYINNSSLVPDDVDVLFKKRIKYSYDTSFSKNILDDNTINELEFLKIQLTNQFTKTNEEIFLIERPIDLNHDSYLLNKILIDSVFPKNFLNKEIRLINEAFLNKLYSNNFTINHVCYVDNQYYVISTFQGLKEWEYQLKQKKKIAFDEAIFADRSSSYLDQAFSQVNYWSGQELKEITPNNVENNILNEIRGVSWATSFLNEGYLHHAINIQKGLHEKEDQKILWTASVSSILNGPFIMKNHKTGTKDIFIQDTTHSICFFSASGNLKWKFSLDQPIISSVSQIDIYSNNKWQMVFNTKDKLYVVDINGNNVDGFPVSFNYLATNGVGVIDYDLNEDYRFLVAGNDNKIHNYNIYGKKVKGWNSPKTNSIVICPVEHFSIAGKDYVFVKENNGTIQFLNRRGEKRHESIEKVFIKPNSNCVIQKSYCIDSSSLVYVDSANQLKKTMFYGEVSSVDFDLDSNSIYVPFIYESTASNLINYGFISEENLMIYGPEKQIYLDKENRYNLKNNLAINIDNNYLILFNDKIDEIELVDNRFQEIPTFFRGTKKCTIGDLNNDGVDELITIINESTLLCYQIAISN